MASSSLQVVRGGDVAGDMAFWNPRRLWTGGPWDVHHNFERSWCMPAWMFATYRGVVAVYLLTSTIFALYYDATQFPASLHQSSHSFYYFTNLSFWAMTVYYMCATTGSIGYAYSIYTGRNRAQSTSSSSSSPTTAQRQSLAYLRSPMLKTLHSLLFTTVTVFPLLVTLTFWNIIGLSPMCRISSYCLWSNTTRHVLNSVFAGAELLLSATDLPPLMHLPALLVIVALYLGLTQLTLRTQHWTPYPFLDTRFVPRELFTRMVFGIGAFTIVFFFVVFIVILARRALVDAQWRRECRARKAVATRETQAYRRWFVTRWWYVYCSNRIVEEIEVEGEGEAEENKDGGRVEMHAVM